jgi:mannose-1-phosphate guanylyltransferase
VRLRYIEEPRPLGTGGALRFAGDLLDERFLMLNGDVLCDLDLAAQLAQHERTGARATLALVSVEDPSAYGLVRLAADGSVTEFLEKPSADQVDTNLINAGAYVLERSVLDAMPAPGTNISIERDVFPELVGDGLFGFAATGYWLDIGTPERYLQGTFDILEGNVLTPIGERLAAAGGALTDGARIDGRVVAPALVAEGSTVAGSAIVGGRAVLGPGVVAGDGVHIEGSVLMTGGHVGAGTSIRASIIGPGATIGEHCHVDGAVLGEGVQVGPGNTLVPGTKLA